jgi:hypothetical protein
LRAPDSISICKILETKEAVRERRRLKSGRSMAEQRRKNREEDEEEGTTVVW